MRRCTLLSHIWGIRGPKNCTNVMLERSRQKVRIGSMGAQSVKGGQRLARGRSVNVGISTAARAATLEMTGPLESHARKREPLNWRPRGDRNRRWMRQFKKIIYMNTSKEFPESEDFAPRFACLAATVTRPHRPGGARHDKQAREV